MTQANIRVGLACLAALVWSVSARAEDKKDWFESEPDASKGEKVDPETGETTAAAPQEEGGAPEASKRGGWLTPGSIALNAGVHLGMGGTERIDRSGLDSDSDMVATIGMQIGGEYVLHKYFAAGGELRLSGINTETDADADVGRDMLTDIMLRPRGRYVIESIGLETYAALPFGISFPNINDDKSGDASVGFALGMDFGVNYFFTEHWGLGSSIGWLWHWFGVEQTSLSTGDKYDLSLRTSQFTWFLSALYML
jgi:hypothetical protein